MLWVPQDYGDQEPFSRNSDETLTGFSQSRVIPYDENVTSPRRENSTTTTTRAFLPHDLVVGGETRKVKVPNPVRNFKLKQFVLPAFRVFIILLVGIFVIPREEIKGKKRGQDIWNACNSFHLSPKDKQLKWNEDFSVPQSLGICEFLNVFQLKVFNVMQKFFTVSLLTQN